MSANSKALNRPQVTRKVAGVVAEILGTDAKAMTPGTMLVDDLGMDSVAAAEIMVSLEESFDIEFGQDAVEELTGVKTVGDLAGSVASRLHQGPDQAGT